jgi:hypothetical protein
VLVSGRDAGRGRGVVTEIQRDGGEADFLEADLATVNPLAILRAAQRKSQGTSTFF